MALSGGDPDHPGGLRWLKGCPPKPPMLSPSSSAEQPRRDRERGAEDEAGKDRREGERPGGGDECCMKVPEREEPLRMRGGRDESGEDDRCHDRDDGVEVPLAGRARGDRRQDAEGVCRNHGGGECSGHAENDFRGRGMQDQEDGERDGYLCQIEESVCEYVSGDQPPGGDGQHGHPVEHAALADADEPDRRPEYAGEDDGDRDAGGLQGDGQIGEHEGEQEPRRQDELEEEPPAVPEVFKDLLSEERVRVHPLPPSCTRGRHPGAPGHGDRRPRPPRPRSPPRGRPGRGGMSARMHPARL